MSRVPRTEQKRKAHDALGVVAEYAHRAEVAGNAWAVRLAQRVTRGLVPDPDVIARKEPTP